MTLLYNADRMLAECLCEVTTPPPPVDYLAWAKEHIEFSPGTSDFPGKYNEKLFPFFTEILHALSPEDPCRFVTLAKSAQVGGTVLANIFALGTIDLDPCLFLYVHPTDEMGDRWSKQKLTPMIRESEHLRSLFPDKSRDAANSVRYKERKDGRGAIQVAGANSAANLSQMSCKCQVHDDVAKWEDNAGGDPESQAESRAKTYRNAKIFKISTPLISPGCRISRAYDAGSQETYRVPCPHCGGFQALDWENMRDHIDLDHPERAHFRCVHCGEKIEERHRAWMVDPANGAHWFAKHPERKGYHRSFHIWMAYSPLERWETIAREWAKVQRGAAEDASAADRRSIEQTFYNDSLGLPLVLDQAAVDWELLRDRAEENTRQRGVVPARALALTLGIDVQETWVEWTLWGWGPFAYSAPIDHGRIDDRAGREGLSSREHSGHISEPEVRAALSALLRRKWRDENGVWREIDLAAIDGNYSTDDVWQWAREHPRSRVIMVRGGSDPFAPAIKQVSTETNAKGRQKRKAYTSRFFNFNASEFKMRLYRHLAKEDPDQPGYVDLPAGLGDEFFQQLVSEVREPVQSRGRLTWRWVLPHGKRNEVLDNANQARAAAYRLGIPLWGDDEWDARRDALARIAPSEPDLEDLIMKPQAPADVSRGEPEQDRAERIARARRNRRGR
ncbi:phage terminase large subunit family protein [Oricola thermophila]|uniref:Phage terminase large subunit family protein n=1 Tax=Oricola thermophila TaxID=2742145 RepID=A0A6N1VCK0_9HYPH|nr:terminase gpA endonuclease subunit [Oricola thermophila]QKV18726.1 phage terminase large subunit family protein [Oricola thermophila]